MTAFASARTVALGALLSFAVTVSQEGSARPVEVIESLFGAEVAADTDLARRALWAEQAQDRIDPLHMPALRARLVPATPRPAAAAAP